MYSVLFMLELNGHGRINIGRKWKPQYVSAIGENIILRGLEF